MGLGNKPAKVVQAIITKDRPKLRIYQKNSAAVQAANRKAAREAKQRALVEAQLKQREIDGELTERYSRWSQGDKNYDPHKMAMVLEKWLLKTSAKKVNILDKLRKILKK